MDGITVTNGGLRDLRICDTQQYQDSSPRAKIQRHSVGKAEGYKYSITFCELRFGKVGRTLSLRSFSRI